MYMYTRVHRRTTHTTRIHMRLHTHTYKICMHTHTRTYTHVLTCVYVHVYVCVCMHNCVYVHTRVCAIACVYTCCVGTYVYERGCTCTDMYVYVCVLPYMYKYMYTTNIHYYTTCACTYTCNFAGHIGVKAGHSPLAISALSCQAAGLNSYCDFSTSMTCRHNRRGENQASTSSSRLDHSSTFSCPASKTAIPLHSFSLLMRVWCHSKVVCPFCSTSPKSHISGV